ncbi:hypothetical protein AAFM46_04420 [Arthrobacter sp. TMP15]|uniref:hypothetical protein n=1 Tax=Arthrobacter sp. TMP15 TaxID=3140789 RepID=UPI0031BA3C5A
MSRGALSAVDWVRELPRGARIHWDELEAHVFREHRAVLSLLGPAADEVRMQGRAFGIVSGLVIAISCLIGLAIMWAPIWGLATLAGDPFGVEDVDGAQAIPVAGVAMIVSTLVQLGTLLRRALRNGVGGADDKSIAGGTIILGVLTLAGILTIGVRQQPPAWEIWLVPTILTIVLAVLINFLSNDLHESPGPFAKRAPQSLESDFIWTENMRVAVASLPQTAQESLRADLHKAIDILRMQGTISPELSAQAMAAELGMLHHCLPRLDPR